MDELIAKLETATGPSRDLDADICLATKRPSGIVRAPAYTASIDAALTLVPNNACWEIHGDYKGGDQHSAIVWQETAPSYWTIKTESDAASPAIALCIAALRARAAVLAPT
jgi:hypothetical protein